MWMLNKPKPGPTLETSPTMPKVLDSDVSSVPFSKSRVMASASNVQLYTTTVDLPQDPFLYKDLIRLGEGAHGTVFKGMCHGTLVAVKFMKPSVHENQLFEREAQIASSVMHPRCVLLLGAFKLKESVVLISEYIENGNLADLLFKPTKPLSLNQKLEIAIEIAEGMAWLSEGQTTIIHKDLKPHNILMTRECHCKIADFGLSCLQDKSQQVGSKSGGGTLGYMAPEVLTYYKNPLNDIVTVKSDVYSFGVMLFEILNQKKFTDLEDWETLENYILSGDRPEFTCDISQELQNLVASCWSVDPNERPLFNQICQVLKAELFASDRQLKSNTLLGQQEAIEFWNKHTTNQKEIKLQDFTRYLLQALPKPEETQPEHLQDELASLLFPGTSKTSFSQQAITLSRFGYLLSWFGAFSDLVLHIFELSRQEWFHGAINRQSAELLLRGSVAGTFLVRVNTGSNPDSPVGQFPHTISFVCPTSVSVLHVRLAAGTSHFKLRLPLTGRNPIEILNKPIVLIIQELQKQGICRFPRKKEGQKNPYIE